MFMGGIIPYPMGLALNLALFCLTDCRYHSLHSSDIEWWSGARDRRK